MNPERKKALFLDRDGVINVAPPPGQYVSSWKEFRLRPGIADLIRRARAMSYLVVVTTNQRGVDLGFLTLEDLEDIHLKMKARLAERGALIDAVYYCAHGLEDGCVCRKPQPGMLLRAAEDWHINLADSLFIGDSDIDIEAGERAGCQTCKLLF